MSGDRTQSNGTKPSLVRVLKLGDVIGIVVGSVIGSGIFIVPATIAAELGSPLWMAIAWAVGGALTLFGALCFSELGAMYPHAGGMYVYLREAYGPLPGFLFGWTLFLVIDSGAVATLAAAFTSKYLPQFVTLSPLGSKLVIVAFVGVLTLVNILGVRHGANLQNGLTLIKFAAILAVSVLVFAFGHGDPANLTSPPPQPIPGSLIAHFGAALIACLWAYKGWEAATFATGELTRPERNLFWGLLTGMLAVLALYVVTNLAYLWVLPSQAIATSSRVAADALTLSIGNAGASVISLLILLSIFGAANSIIMTTPRVFYAMASDGLFFQKVREVHPRFLTPHVAIIALAVWTVILALTGTFEQLFNYVIFGQWIFFGLTVGAVMILRRTRPDAPRPVRVWGYPVTPAIFIAASAFIAISSFVNQPLNALAGLGLIALGVPVYLYWRRRSAKGA